MLGSLVLLIHPDAITRVILVEQLGPEFRWIVAAGAADVPTSFDEAPALILGDADGVPELDALCARLRARLRAVRSIALTRDYRAHLPSVDTLLVKPVPLDQVRHTLLLEARLGMHMSSSRARGGRSSVDEYDPDDVATPRIRY